MQNDTDDIPDHVVIDAEAGGFRCERCGMVEEYPFPVRLTKIAEDGRIFGAKHAACPPPEIANGSVMVYQVHWRNPPDFRASDEWHVWNTIKTKICEGVYAHGHATRAHAVQWIAALEPERYSEHEIRIVPIEASAARITGAPEPVTVRQAIDELSRKSQ